MATISQAPTALSLSGVAGDPFALTVDVNVIDASGNPVPWADVTSPLAALEGVGSATLSQFAPTVTSPIAGQWVLAWTAAQTTAMAAYSGLSWSLSATIEGGGPYALVAGGIAFNASTQPGTSGPTNSNVNVQVGSAVVSLAVTLGSAGVQSVTAGDGTITIGGTPLAPTVKVTPSVFDSFGAAAAEAARALAAEALLAPLASPALTGAPTAPTAAPLDASTKLATTGYADAATAVEKARALAAEAAAIATAEAASDPVGSATTALATATTRAFAHALMFGS